MDFIDIETTQGRMLINIYEIKFIMQLQDGVMMKLNGSDITIMTNEPLTNIIDQLNGYDDDTDRLLDSLN